MWIYDEYLDNPFHNFAVLLFALEALVSADTSNVNLCGISAHLTDVL